MRKALWAVLIAVGLALPASAYAATLVLPRFSPAPPHPPVAQGGWTNLAPVVTPPNEGYGSIAYDSKADRAIYFPGNGSETWAYNLSADSWVNLNPPASPHIAERSAMVYDSLADRIVLYGGNAPPLTNETWAYDFNANRWTNLHPRNAPPARAQHEMVYDALADRVVMYGGSPGTVCCGSLTDETWVYDFSNNTWTEMHPSLAPSARDLATMAYDSRRGLVVLFGGQTAFGNHFANDTWTYNLTSNEWTKVATAGAPPQLMSPGMVYDEAADRIVLFGGEWDNGTTAGYSNQTWIYNPGAKSWSKLDSQPSPLGRYWPNLAYDSVAKAVLLVGGFWYTNVYYDPNPKLADTWRFDYPSAA
jgi:hypothetical protein